MLAEAGTLQRGFSAACTRLCGELVPERTVLVAVSDGVQARFGTIGAYLADQQLIQLDQQGFELPNEVAAAELVDDPQFWPIAGVLLHEMAHARFTVFSEIKSKHRRTVDMLEESRIESHWIRSNPQHRSVLACAAGTQILNGMKSAEPGSTYDLHAVLLLLMARRDAGSLTDTQVKHLEAELPDGLLARVQPLWNECFATEHRDIGARHEIAARFDAILSEYYSSSPEINNAALKTATEARNSAPEPSLPRPTNNQPQPQGPRTSGELPHRSQTCCGAKPERRTNQKTRRPGNRPSASASKKQSVLRTRPPTRTERISLAALNRRLTNASFTTTESTEIRPPGRLHLPLAVRQKLQSRVGGHSSIRPWRRETPRTIRQPSLGIVIIHDVSASMSASDEAAGQLVWALESMKLPADSFVERVAFGTTMRPIPACRDVTRFGSCENTASFKQAARYAKARLLSRSVQRPVAAIISDAEFPKSIRTEAIAASAALTAAGVPQIWIDIEEPTGRPASTSWESLSDPFACAWNIISRVIAPK